MRFVDDFVRFVEFRLNQAFPEPSWVWSEPLKSNQTINLSKAHRSLRRGKSWKRSGFRAQMKTHFCNLPLRLASALCLLLLAAGHTAFGAVTFTGDTSNDGTTVIVGDTGEGSLLIDGGSSLSELEVTVGYQTGSVGNVTVSSGSLTTSWLYVGPEGTGTLNINGGTVIVGANLTKGGNGIIQLNAGGTLQIGAGGDSGNLSVGNLSNNGTLAFNRRTNSTYSDIISGTGAVTKSGNGTLTLNGANTYTGTTTISAGTLQIGAGGTTGSLTSDITNSGLLRFNRSDNSTYSGNISGTSAVTNLGAGTLTLNGSNTYTGNTTISAGTLQVGANGTTGSLTSNITNNATLVFSRSDNSTYSGVISGTGAVTKSGAGTLTLSGNNTYTGSTTISAGTLQVGDGGRISSSSIFTVGSASGDNATLNLTGGNVSNTIGYVGNSTGSTGTVNVSGGNWANSAGLTIGRSGTGSLTISSGTVSNTSGIVGKSITSTGTVNVSGGNWTNTLDLVIGQTGNGTLNLTGNGTVRVDGGPVTLANTSGKTGTLNLGNGTTAGTLSAATIIGGNGTAVVNINQSGTYTLGSNMTGSLSLNHTGTGTTTLTGANTYTGNTTVSAGTLKVNGSTSASLFTIASGATLGGNGTIGGATTIYGIHSPGNSPGIQTFTGNLTYALSGASGPTVNWQLSGNTDTDLAAFDQIVVGGNLAFNTPTSLVLDFSGYGDVDWADSFWTTDQSWVIYDVAGTTTGESNLSIATANWLDYSGDSFDTILAESSFSLGLQGNDLVLSYTAGTSPVPEPSQVAASLLALSGIGIYLWRRKHTAQAKRQHS
jgi:autotransporter-associated beta strand protein/T5SS/PEP-CTERM-associated repeat protein